MKKLLYVYLIFTLILFAACGQTDSGNMPESPDGNDQDPELSEASSLELEETSEPEPESQQEDEPEPLPFQISSSGITDGILADAYGAKGSQKSGNVPTLSPPLEILNIPEGTQCIALTMIDPDGGDWVHWLAVNIPPGSLAENAGIDLAETILQGKNDFGSLGYGGPTPPSGTHTYVFTVYALSEAVELNSGFSRSDFNRAIEGKILDQAVLHGDYSS